MPPIRGRQAKTLYLKPLHDMIKTLQHDTDGYLMPVGKIPCSISIIEAELVEAFPQSTTRYRLWVQYLRFIERFRTYITRHFIQWIDGSFVTKKENPKDIDLVTFIDYSVFKAMENELEAFWTYNLEQEGIDSYIVPVLPKESENYPSYIETCQEWERIYTNAKLPNKQIVAEAKGFLELKFT